MRLGVAALPDGCAGDSWSASPPLAGIGFTVSLFVTGLAFEGDDVLGDAARVGILIASTVAAALGALVFIVGRTPTSSADD